MESEVVAATLSPARHRRRATVGARRQYNGRTKVMWSSAREMMHCGGGVGSLPDSRHAKVTEVNARPIPSDAETL